MERYPFEYKIQSYFKDRKIQPSENVWAKLEDQLDEKPPGKKIFSIFWVRSIAVSIVLMVMIITVYRSTENSKSGIEVVTLEPIMTNEGEIGSPTIAIEEIEKDVKEAVASTSNNIAFREKASKPIRVQTQAKEIISDRVEAGESDIKTETKIGLNILDEETENNGIAYTKELPKKPSIRIDASRLLAAVDQTITEKEVIADVKDHNPGFRVDAEKLLADVEKAEIKTFMNRLTEGIIKSGDLIAGIISRQDQ